jgi:gas vesicle protein GvpN
VHPEFRAILTSNSVEYAGVHEPQDALLDRLVGVYMDFYDHETEVAIVEEHIGEELTQPQIESIVGVFRDLREELDIGVGTRAEIMAAEGLAAANTGDDGIVRDVCVDVLASKVAEYDEVASLQKSVETVLEEHDLAV